jgi:surface antigen
MVRKKYMLVKSTMVLMTSLILGLSVSSVYADTRIPLSATAGVRTDYHDPSNSVAIFLNIFKQASGSLSSEDRETHIRTVIFAAQNLPTGEEAAWANPENKTAGKVKIVMTRPTQGGVCRVLFTQVEKSGHVRDYHEVACRTIDSQFWSFSSR